MMFSERFICNFVAFNNCERKNKSLIVGSLIGLILNLNCNKRIDTRFGTITRRIQRNDQRAIAVSAAVLFFQCWCGYKQHRLVYILYVYAVGFTMREPSHIKNSKLWKCAPNETRAGRSAGHRFACAGTFKLLKWDTIWRFISLGIL